MPGAGVRSRERALLLTGQCHGKVVEAWEIADLAALRQQVDRGQ
jgi:hypothetical protein